MSRNGFDRLNAAAGDPDASRAIALDILARRRERALIDAALAALTIAPPGEADRPILRALMTELLDHKQRDQGCHIREALTRFLLDIDNPADLDLYLRAVDVHEQLFGVDVGQKLRAAALTGIARIDPRLGIYHAIRLLQDLPDTSRFSGEPAVTAVRVLALADQRAAIYHLLLSTGQTLVAEVAAAALESLGDDFPPDLYREITQPYLDADRAVPLSGVIAHIVSTRAAALYDLLLTIIERTADGHLYRYALIEMAASRDPDLMASLHALARRPARWPVHLSEALRLLPDSDPQRDESLARLA